MPDCCSLATLGTLFSSRKIEVIDIDTNRVIASWPIPVQGWPGDITAKRVAELLKTPKRPEHAGFKINTNATSQALHTRKWQDLPELEQLLRLDTCEGKVRTISGGAVDQKPVLVAADWRLRLPQSYRNILCNEHGIFINSPYLPEHLDLIWLGYNGELRLSSYVEAEQTKIGGAYYPSVLVDIEVTDGNLVVHRLFLTRTEQEERWRIDKGISYSIPIGAPTN